MTIGSKIDKELKKIDLHNSLVLFIVNANEYSKANNHLIKYLVKKKKQAGIYVTVNKPYNVLKKVLNKNGVNTEKVIFIDAITRSTGKKDDKCNDCVFIGSPQDLTGISIAITQAVKAFPTKEKFVFFDSLSTLSIHNSSGSVTKFAHFLTSRMKTWGVTGVIMSIERESDETLLGQLAQFCDEVIDLGGKKR